MILKSCNIRINKKDNNGFTALHIAAASGILRVVDILVDHKILNGSVHLPADNGITPLHEAAKNGHLDIVKYFIEE